MVINQKAANVWTARFIPLVLIGIICYTSFVIVQSLCVNYLLNPPATLQTARPGPAIAILVIYFILLFFVATTYFRILFAVLSNPGYVERGPLYYASRKPRSSHPRLRSGKTRSSSDGSDEKASRDLEKGIGAPGYTNGYSQAGGIVGGRPSPESDSPGLQNFWNKEVFVCEGDGRPIWCSMCMNWKPDRTHHCREVERCVRKMDHFCPWVGGIVSEMNFKFFVQFNSWTAMYCMFILICLAIFTKEVSSRNENLNVHWVVTMALAGLFTFFTLGMSLSSLQFVLLNTTSVENLSRQTKIWTLAVHISRPPTNPNHKPFQTITYPLTPPPPGTPSTPPKTFAILHSKPGENPYNLGYYGNFKSVMGNNVFDWLVPLRYSPCCDHDSGESAFALGPVVQRMCEEAGLSPAHEGGKRRERQWGDISPERDGGGKHQRHRRRRRSRRQSGSRRKPRESAPVEQEAGERSDVAGSVIEHEDDEVVVR